MMGGESGKHFPLSVSTRRNLLCLGPGTMADSVLVLLDQSINHESCSQLDCKHHAYSAVVVCHGGSVPHVLCFPEEYLPAVQWCMLC